LRRRLRLLTPARRAGCVALATAAGGAAGCVASSDGVGRVQRQGVPRSSASRRINEIAPCNERPRGSVPRKLPRPELPRPECLARNCLVDVIAVSACGFGVREGRPERVAFGGGRAYGARRGRSTGVVTGRNGRATWRDGGCDGPCGTSERSAGTDRVRRVLARSISLRHA
jgi:hypothetical protein